jgi:hypothetical protein
MVNIRVAMYIMQKLNLLSYQYGDGYGDPVDEEYMCFDETCVLGREVEMQGVTSLVTRRADLNLESCDVTNLGEILSVALVTISCLLLYEIDAQR